MAASFSIDRSGFQFLFSSDFNGFFCGKNTFWWINIFNHRCFELKNAHICICANKVFFEPPFFSINYNQLDPSVVIVDVWRDRCTSRVNDLKVEIL